MLSFKQYLKEDAYPEGTMHLKLYLEVDRKTSPEETYKILLEHFPTIIEFKNLNNVYDYALFSIYEDIDSNYIDNLLKQFFDLFPNKSFQKFSTEYTIFSYGYPEHKINLPNGNFTFINHKMTLEKIDKQIIDIHYLSFTALEKVTGNVLGLLKIPSLKGIYAQGASMKAPWVDIVNTYIKGDRNILKCQRELIQNGLKEYAKF